MAATLASRHVGADDADGAPAGRRRPAGRRVDDVVDEVVAPPPAAGGRARGGEAAFGDDDGRAGVVEGGVVAVGQEHDPAAVGRRAGDGQVAAEAHQHADAGGGMGRLGGAVGAPGLGRGAEVELDARGHEHRVRRPVDDDGVASPGSARPRPGGPGRAASTSANVRS